MPANVIATSFALIAFSAAVAVGIASDNPAETVIWRGMVAMLLCWPVGWAVGNVACHTVDRHIERYKQEHPIPEEGAQDSVTQSGVEIVEEG